MNVIHRVTIVASLFTLFTTTGVAQTFTTVVDSGDPSNRVDVIIIGDGYQESELETEFAEDVDNTINYLFSEGLNPFPRYQNFFNFHRVNVASKESGADDPNLNFYVDTALDASYNWGGTDRCLYFSTSKANTAMNTALSGSGIDVDMRLGCVNSIKYGGCGGSWAVWAAGNGAALEIAVHELGHSFGNLADEYFYTQDTWTGGEPGSVNCTSDPLLGKWDRWLGYDDPDSNIGPIGYYEGCRYHAFGLYRPSDNSKMRALGRPFDAISRERFIEKIFEEVQPLDDWIPEQLDYSSGDVLWVDSVDPNVINVEWFVDGVSLGVLGETIEVDSLELKPGIYEISAVAYDGILDHAFTGSSLDWWRLANTSLLEQEVGWTVVVGETTEIVVVDDVDVNAGVYRAGSVTDMVASDNVDLSYSRDRGSVSSSVSIEFKATANISNPSLMEVTFESSVFARNEVTQTLSLYDFQTSSWEVVDSRPASRFVDSTVVVNPTGDLSRFIDSSGGIEALVEYQGDIPRLQFTASVDQFIWNLTN